MDFSRTMLLSVQLHVAVMTIASHGSFKSELAFEQTRPPRRHLAFHFAAACLKHPRSILFQIFLTENLNLLAHKFPSE